MEDNPIITTGIQAKFLKRWTAFRIPSKLLIIVALCECTAILVVAGFSLGRGAQASVCSTSTSPNSTNIIQKSDLPAYYLNQGIALIAWTVFFGVSVFDGTFSGNIYELYAAMLMALFVSAWSISRAIDTTFPNDFLDYLFLGTACFPQLFYIGVSPNLYKEYAWVLYRKAGADMAIRSLYIQYLIWSCLLKLDTVFGILSTFLSGRGVCNGSTLSALDYSTLTICLLFLGIGYYVVQREFIQYTRLWFLLFPILPTYNIAYLVLQYSIPLDPETEHTWYTLRILYTVLAGLSLAAWLGLVYFTYIVYNNFGKGLVTLAQEKKIEKEKEQQRTKNASTIDDDDDDDDDFNDGDGYLNYSGNNETTPGDQRASDDGWSLKDVIANTYALEDGTQVGPVKKY